MTATWRGWAAGRDCDVKCQLRPCLRAYRLSEMADIEVKDRLKVTVKANVWIKGENLNSGAEE